MRPAFSRHRAPTPISMLNVNAYEKSLPKEARRSTGAAYRIRTCDVLIRSQTLYPAEVTPQRKEYNHMMPALSQELFFALAIFLTDAAQPSAYHPSGCAAFSTKDRPVQVVLKRRRAPRTNMP